MLLAPHNHLFVGNDTDTITISVNLDDANDSPKFNSSQYNATVEENKASGVFVTRVYATDIDQQQGNRLFTYALQQNFGKFRIDSQTGGITTTGKLLLLSFICICIVTSYVSVLFQS